MPVSPRQSPLSVVFRAFAWFPVFCLALGICAEAEGGYTDWFAGLGANLDVWGAGGAFTHAIGADDDSARAALALPDGKLLVAGRQFNGTHNDFVVVRYHPDGSLDTAFDADGIRIISFAEGESIVHAMATDSFGRIVIAGRQWGYADYDFGIVRLLSDGASDPSFNGAGQIRVDLGGFDFPRGIAIDAAERIVIAGDTYQGSHFDIAVVRLLSDGSLDNAFDGDGMVTTAIGTSDDFAYAVALQADQKIVVGGASVAGTTPRFAVARYLTNGALDPSFSGDGMDAWPLGVSDDVAWAIAIDSSQQIHLAGRSEVGGSYRMALASYGTDGTRGLSGQYEIGSGAVARGIAVDGNNKILAGRAYNGSDWDFALIRITSSAGSFGLDGAFNGSGRVITSVGTADDIAYGMAIQSDDKVILAGGTFGSNSNFGLVRLRAQGTLDSTFGTGGRVSTAVGASEDVAYDVALQADGKIVAAGFSNDGTNNDFAVVRYLTTGSLDGTFGTGGIRTTSVGSGNAVANAIAIQADGKIYLAGTANNGSNGDFALARYHTNGTQDSSFDGDGLLLSDFNSGHDAAHAVRIDSVGKIVAAGFADNGASRQFAVARFHTNGALDTSFSSDGKVTVGFLASSNDVVYDMRIQEDGRILLAGQTHNATRTACAMARLLDTGALDASFDGDGLLVLDIDTAHGTQCHALALQTDGRSVIAGRTLQIQNRIVLSRRHTNGAIDTSFDSDGYLVLSLSSSDDVAYALDVDNSGRIVGAGHSWTANMDFSAFRVTESVATAAGLDVTFNGDGRVTTPIGPGNDVALALAVGGGKVIVAGYADNGTNLDWAVARYDGKGDLAGAGALDPSFDGDGAATTDIGGSADLAHAVVLQADDKIIAAGRSHNGANDDFALVRYTTAGTLDPTFDSDGVVVTAIGASHDVAHDVRLDFNGRVIAGGYAVSGTTKQFALARYGTNGVLDGSFSSDGITTTSFAANSDDVIYALAIQSDNKIIAGGRSHNATRTAFALARYTETGTLDVTFDSDGLVTTEIDTGAGSQLHGLTLQPDGKIVAVGRTMGVSNQIAVLRYLTSGALDPSFDSDGIAITSATAGDDIAYAVEYREGRLLVIGQGYGASTYDLLIARYASDGSLDTAFDGDGVSTTAISTNDDFGYAAAVQPNGKIVAVGFTYLQSHAFGLARFLPWGAVDTGFGVSGSVATALGTKAVAQDVAIAADGRIVVVGYSANGGSYDFAVARYFP